MIFFFLVSEKTIWPKKTPAPPLPQENQKVGPLEY